MYNYSYGEAQIEEIMPMIIGMLVVGFAIAFVIVGVFYVLQAVGMMGIAKNRGMKNPWLGFIPIGESFLFGGIADNINESYGKKTYFRIILPILSGVGLVAVSLFFVWYFRFLYTFIEMAMYGIEPRPEHMFAEMAPFLIFYILMLFVSIANTVLICVVMYRIGKEYAPQSAVAYVILTVFFNLYAMSIILFSLRNKAPWYMQAQHAPAQYAPQQYQQPQQYAPPNEQAPPEQAPPSE